MRANDRETGKAKLRRKLKWVLFPLKVVGKVLINLPVAAIEVLATAYDIWENESQGREDS
jgi:hypothetical protein